MPGNNPTIGLQFDYKKSLDAMIRELEKRFEEIDKLGDGAKFTDKIDKQLLEMKAELESFKTTLKSLEKDKISANAFEEFSKKIQDNLASMEAQSKAFDKELKRLDTSIADLGDGSVGKLNELAKQFKGLDTTVKNTQETIQNLLGLMKKLSPDTPLLNFGKRDEIDRAEALTQQIDKLDKIEFGKRNGFYTSKDFKNDNAYLEEAIKLYSDYYEKTFLVKKAEEELAKARNTNGENVAKIGLAEAKVDLAELLAQVRAFYAYIEKRDVSTKVFSDFKDQAQDAANALIDIVKFKPPVDKDAFEFINRVQDEYEKKYNTLLQEGREFSDQLQRTINSEQFTIKEGKITVPLKLGVVLDTLYKEIDATVAKIQEYANEHPAFVTVSAKQSDGSVPKSKTFEQVKGQLVDKIYNTENLTLWYNEYAKILAQVTNMATQMKSIADDSKRVADPKNLQATANYLTQITGLTTPDIFKTIQDFKLDDASLTNLLAFAKAISDVNKEAKGLNKIQEAFTGLSALVSVLARFPDALKGIDFSGLNTKLMQLAGELKGVEVDKETAENTQLLGDTIASLSDLLDTLPTDYSRLISLSNAVKTLNTIKIKDGLNDFVSKGSAVAGHIKDLVAKLPSDYSKLDKAVEVNKLNDITLDSNDLFKRIYGLPGVTSWLVGIAQSINTISESLSSELTGYDKLPVAINGLSRITVSSEDVSKKISGLLGVYQVLRSVAGEIKVVNSYAEDIKSITTLINVINSLSGINVNGNEVLGKIAGILPSVDIIHDISYDFANIKNNIKEGVPDLSGLIVAINQLGKLNVTGADIQGKTAGLSNATRTLPTIAKNITAFTGNLPTEADSNKYTAFVAAVNGLKEINITKNESNKLDKVIEAVGKIKQISADLPTKFEGFDNLVKSVNNFSTGFTFGEDFTANIDVIKALVRYLKTLAGDGLPTSYPAFDNFITTVNNFRTGFNFDDDFIANIDAIKALVRMLKSLASGENMPTSYPPFDNLITTINNFRTGFNFDEDFIANINVIHELVKLLKALAGNGMPTSYPTFDNLITTVNGLKTGFQFDETFKENIEIVNELVVMLKGLAGESMPTSYPAFDNFVATVNNLKTIDIGSDTPQKVEDIKKIASNMVVIKHLIPEEFPSFKPFVDAIQPLNNKSASLPEDIATKYDGLKPLAETIKEATNKLPKGFSKLTNLFTALGTLNKNKVNHNDAVALYELAVFLERLKPLLEPNSFNKGEMDNISSFLTTLSKAKVGADAVENFKQLPQIFSDIKEALKDLPEGTNKFVEFITNVLSKKDELSNLATVLKSGILNARKAQVMLGDSNYDIISNNYKQMIKLQKELKNSNSSKTVLETLELIENLNKKNAELSKGTTFTDKEKATIDSLAQSWKIARDEYGKYVKDTLNAAQKKKDEEKAKSDKADAEEKAKAAKDATEAYNKLQKAINDYYNASKKIGVNGTDKDLQRDTQARNDAYQRMIEYEQAVNSYREKGLITEEQYSDLMTLKENREKDMIAIREAAFNELKSEYDIYSKIESQSEEYIGSLSKAKEQIEIINKLLAIENKGGMLDPNQAKELEDALGRLRKATASLKANKPISSDVLFNREDIEKYIASLDGVDSRSIKVSKSAGNMIATYRQLNGDVTTVTYSLNQQTQQWEELSRSISHASGLGGAIATFQEIGKSFATYLSAAMLVRRAWQSLKSGFSIVKEIDKQFTEMRKVSDETVLSLREYVKESYEVAKATGSTATSILSSTADYMRIGKSLAQAAELAKNTTILMNVSEFDNVNDATDALIAMTQAYTEFETGLSSLDIIDKLNKIGELVA